MSTANEYYLRQPTVNSDGRLIMFNERDGANEKEVAALLEKAWNCSAISLGRLAAIDWVFVRHGKPVGVGELKVHPYSITKYDCAMLSLRKWLSLTLAANGLGVPATIVYRYSDTLSWIPLSLIDASRVRMWGPSRPRAIPVAVPIEPFIEIPCESLRLIDLSAIPVVDTIQ